MSEPEHFRGLQFRPVKLPEGCPYRPVGLALGNGQSALEVVVATADSEPRSAAVRSAWKARSGGRAAPLMLVVLHDGKAVVCGPAGDDPPAYPNVDIGQAERICREALEQPDRHAALRCLRDALPSVESRLPGIRNEGFLATHELARGVRASSHWAEAWANAEQKARPLLADRGEPLLRKLGFQIEKVDQVTSLLRASTDGRKIAVAVLLHQSESPELQADRFGSLSPVSYALAVADRENLPYVVVSQGSKLRLYPVKVGVGVGQRGRTETYVEVHTGLLRDTDAGYLWLLFSADALIEGGTLEKLLDESKRFAGELAERLRERIYGEVVPRLAEGLAAARGLKHPTAADLADTYEMAMTVLFRLLFVAYAEDKDLLPYKHNGLYRARSLKTKASELLQVLQQAMIERRLPDSVFDDSATHWEEVQRLWRAVEKSNREWGVPEYDGGLFASNPSDSRIGALLADITVPNRVFGPVLRDLLVIQTPEGFGPVDFRSLGVREFGTIYEGLLESELSVAETDLTYDERGKDKGVYRPCRKGEEPKVRQTRIYLHDRSGARKSTGTYFTKEFAVEHLLNHALEPALKEHLERLDKLDDDAAAEGFFDFRVADIAMGSGHFLATAVDHIEQAFTQYLSKRSLAGVRGELAKLRASAAAALGNLADQVEIEDTQLLRRLIARRCIYGVDINPVAVALARVSIWIHTFVPGLPLSLLDHNLVVGNSLVGIGRLVEIDEWAAGGKRRGDKATKRAGDARGQIVLTEWLEPKRLLGDAVEPLRRLARIADATAVELKLARKAMEEARERTKPAEALCDIVTACRMSQTNLPIDLDRWDEVKTTVVESWHHREARNTLAALSPLHFPIAFPEVFLRERSGFDVILGNPPWDKVRFEAQQFWVTRSPGLNALPANQRETEIEVLRRERPLDAQLEQKEVEGRERLQLYIDRAFRLQGRGRHGHHDLAKVFSERAIQVLAADGHLGYVLPRTALVLGGWADIRQALFANRVTATLQARNKAGWLFDDIDYRLMIALVSASRALGEPDHSGVRIWPSVVSVEGVKAATENNAIRLAHSELETLTDSWVIPWFSGPHDRAVFDRMRERPRLGSADGWITAVADSSRWDFSGSGPHREFASSTDPKRGWRVLMTRHIDAFRISREDAFQHFIPEPRDLVALSLGVVLKERRPVVHGDHPTIVYRYPTMNDNTRTLIATALPEEGYLYSKGYVHGLRTPDADVHAILALLGYLNTVLCDWWVRRFTDRHMTLPVLSHIPLPDWDARKRSQIAGLVAALLIQGGTRVIPGGVGLSAIATPTDADEREILARLEHAALEGFELTLRQFDTIREDFSEDGCPDNFVNMLRRLR